MAETTSPSNKTELSFRPHHFLCAFCFQGNGYSAKFVRNFSAIMTTLNAPGGDELPIAVAPDTDSICAPCPHRRGTLCESEAKVRQLDAQHKTVFALKNDTLLTWSYFKHILQSTLTIDKFNKICDGCEWKASGICESVLRSSGIK